MKLKKYCLIMLIWGLTINHVHAVQYSYDDLNRLTKAEYESGIVVEYEYDLAGNILKVTTYDKQSGKPIEGGENPGEGTKPDEGAENPEEGTNPDNGGENPGEGTRPDEGEENPGEGTKPDEGGENPGEGTKPDQGGEQSGGGSGNNSDTGSSGGNEKDKKDTNKQDKILGMPSLILKLNGDTYTLNGEDYPIDAKIFISENSRLMAPVRYIAYALNISPDKIKWDGQGKTVTIEGEKTIIISINKNYMLVDGMEVQLNEKAQLVNGRVFLPIADISRAFHINYTWDNTLKQLSLFNQKDSEVQQ